MRNKHFVGDCIRAILIGFLILLVVAYFYNKKMDERDRLEALQRHQEYMREWEERQALEKLKSPEQKLEEFIYGIDNRGVIAKVATNEDSFYIVIGVKEDSENAIENCRGLMRTFSMCAKEEGVTQDLYIIGMLENGTVDWILDEQGNVSNGYIEKVISLESFG